MAGFASGVSTTFVAQIVGAAVMAILLASFQREYRKSYLQHWTFGWAALAAYQLCALILLLASHLAAVRGAAAMAAGAAGFAQIGWFTFGVTELVRRRPVRLRVERDILLLLGGTGLVLGIVFSGATGAGEIARVGGRGAAACVAFIGCGVALWRARRRRAGMGVTVLAAGFFLYGIEQLRYATLVFERAGGSLRALALPLSYVDFLVQALLAVGMIACVLEDEREAAALASAEIEHLAYHDSLTGLPNRPLYIDRLVLAIAQAQRGDQKIAVLFLDLDRFKEINDSLGHSTGDQLLRAVADRIRNCVREGDTLARFGGDEFTLIIPRLENIEDAAKIAQKILDTLKIPFAIADHELFATTSIGISIYPSDGADAETLLRNADTAMYRAKEAGRDTFQLYAPAMNARALERLALENMLRKAVAQNELVLHYQPLMEMRTQTIIGFEALTRWRHPELGLVLPAHFISAAETSGLIVPIGQWVIETACRQIKGWQKKTGRPLIVAVNLSARQFSQPDLVDQVRRALRDTGFDPHCLELEITESSAMHNADNTTRMLLELKKLGVRIAMDDFGTGYSSLNYLKRFPIDTLKLDQMFVRDITSDRAAAAIVSAVIALSHDLQLAVVAEGVETQEQLAFLQSHGCDRIQGHLFSAALAADEVEAYLSGAEVRLAMPRDVQRPA